MQRIDALRRLATLVTNEDLFIASLGALRNDWWNLRPGGVANTFFVSGMGTVCPMALGLATALPHRRIIALDTDGSVLMNTSALATLGNELPPNLTVIVWDNEVYESIGGLSTHTAGRTDLSRMAEAAGCTNCHTVSDLDEFDVIAERTLNDGEFAFVVAKIEPGIHPWPEDQRKITDGVEDKYRFIRYIEELEGVSIHGGPPTPFA